MRHTIFITLFYGAFLFSYSIHRPEPSCLPSLSIRWNDDTTAYTLTSERLTYWPWFTRFDYDHFTANVLPREPITYRNSPHEYVHGATFHALLQDCLENIQASKKRHTQIGSFIVKKDRDFNYKNNSGTIILECTEHPFIVKLFMETPQSMIQPLSKGIEPCFFYCMTGGISRFLAGFTRIKNLHHIRRTIEQSPRWNTVLTMPRKWFWQPDNNRWLTITGTHVGGHGKQHHITVPSTYAVISDKITHDKERTMNTPGNQKLALEITHLLGDRLDAHIDNFIPEKGTDKIAIIDTEHFPSMVGLRKPLEYKNYTQWYVQLARKCFTDVFLQSKKDRKNMHTTYTPPMLEI